MLPIGFNKILTVLKTSEGWPQYGECYEEMGYEDNGTGEI